MKMEQMLGSGAIGSHAGHQNGKAADKTGGANNRLHGHVEGVVDQPDSLTWQRAQSLGRDAAEFAAFQQEPRQMPSATVGKNGFLRARMVNTGTRTVMKDVERRVPFLVQRALYWDTALPEMACVYLMTTSGGVLQGDRYSLEIEADENACAHLTTQSATRIQVMEVNYAVQAQTFRLAEGAYLEYMPEPVIPYRHARFLTDTQIEIAPGATLLYSEILLPGRRYGEGEYFDFDMYVSCVRAVDLATGKEKCCERFVLDPQHHDLRQTGVMQGFDVYANVMLLTDRQFADQVLDLVEPQFNRERSLASGVSRLPNNAGLVFKVLGAEVQPVKARVREFWAAVRKVVKKVELPPAFLWRS